MKTNKQVAEAWANGQRARSASMYSDGVRLFSYFAAYEREFGATIRRGESVERAAARGKPYKGEGAAGLSREYSGPVHVPGAWRMPAGAFTRGEGPT